MPNYDFKCICGLTVEKNVKSTVKLIKCPECGGLLVRQFPNPNFKINGYSYENEYKKEKK